MCASASSRSVSLSKFTVSVPAGTGGSFFDLAVTDATVDLGGFVTLEGSGSYVAGVLTLTNVRLFLGQGPSRFADGTVNPAARGIVVEGVYGQARTVAGGGFVVFAQGALRLVNLGTLSLSTSARVEVNTSSGHDLLDQAASEALKKWRFVPARADGKPSVPARMWVYRSLLVPLNVFDFTVSRHRDGPDQFLIDQDFRGTLLADCYTGYQSIELRSDDRVVHAACNAHARRKVFEARDNHPALAAQLLSIYQKLYDLEDRAREMNPDERLTLRSTEARSVWSEFQMIVEGDLARRVLPKEKMAEALGYLRNHWSALQKYLDDGRLPIDNNETEQLMKQVAIGRKNWLFIGSVDAGRRAANFLTLVSSAVRNDLDANTYLKAVLDALLTGSTDYASLAPERWAQEHPEAIRVYRREERSQRRDTQRDRRQKRRQLTAKRKPN